MDGWVLGYVRAKKSELDIAALTLRAASNSVNEYADYVSNMRFALLKKRDCEFKGEFAPPEPSDILSVSASASERKKAYVHTIRADDFISLMRECAAAANKRKKSVEQLLSERERRQAEAIRKKYTAENGVLIKYRGTGKYAVVPQGITQIGRRAFSESEVTDVVLPDGVTKICENAFENCKELYAVNIPDSVTYIGDGAFSGCGKVQLNIPDGVTYIGKNAFCDCESLGGVTLPRGIADIQPRTFSGCFGLREVNLPSGLKSIGRHAFFNCKSLVKISLPPDLNEIDYYAFGGSGLVNIEVPHGVNGIGMYAFGDCEFLRNVTLPKKFKSQLGDIFGADVKTIKFSFIR